MYPIPGILAVRRREFDNATFATWRTAELGFLGDIVVTLVTTPLTWGEAFKAGVLDKFFFEDHVREFACLSVAIS